MPDDQLSEAHAPASFHERVKALEPGEVARLEGGVAVKHLALEDGRLAYKVGGPRNWGRGDTTFDDYGDTHRTAEDATRAAFRKSAESTDPESIGGATRLSRYAPLDAGGAEVRVQDFTLGGQVVVSHPTAPGQTRTMDGHALVRKTPLLAGLEEEWSPESRAAALAARKAAHPDWNWAKGDWATTKTGSLVQVRDTTPRYGPSVPSHHQGTISVKGPVGSQAVKPEDLTPVGKLKLKTVPTTGGSESRRVQVHLNDEHIGDLVQTDQSHHVVGRTGISIGTQRTKFWNHHAPGQRQSGVIGSGHTTRHEAMGRLLDAHRAKATAKAKEGMKLDDGPVRRLRVGQSAAVAPGITVHRAGDGYRVVTEAGHRTAPLKLEAAITQAKALLRRQPPLKEEEAAWLTPLLPR